jgi:hypothetical protein
MIDASLQEALDLEFAFADARGFVPVQLCPHYGPIAQTHFSISLALTPATPAVTLPQARNLPRMAEPAAIVSALAMSPKILKSMATSFQGPAALVNPENLVRGARNVALEEAVGSDRATLVSPSS